MIKTTKKFYDNRFPTNQNSLIKGFNFFQVNKLNIEKISERTPLQKKFKKIKWIKTFNKNSKNFTIFYQDKIDTEEIKIGEFSNTNFISVLNALLYFPYLIKKLFITKEKKNKVYFQ